VTYALANPPGFFDKLRHGLLGPELSHDEVDRCYVLLAACSALPLAWAAYAFATAYHETRHTLLPIREDGGEAYFRRMYDLQGNRPQVAHDLGNTQPGDGARFAGRGYVQLTGRANYLKAGQALGLGSQLVETPDRALEPAIAAKVMALGMARGWFTGREFTSFLPANLAATRAQFIAARRIINGQDRADLIADYAVEFQDGLSLGGWRAPA
jgi:putative chitinase